MTGSPPDIDGFSLDDLKVLVLQLLEENAALGEEIASLKGPPSIKPSGMDKATDAKPAGGKGKHRRRGGKLSRLTIDEDRIIEACVPPARHKPGEMIHLEIKKLGRFNKA